MSGEIHRGAEAGRHGLAWLVVGNAVGLWLSLLLLFPRWQIGAWTYGRWVPVHLDTQLYGWTALPLAGWLLEIYAVPRRWGGRAAWAWSAALACGVLAWLQGGSSGKIFLDWEGGPLRAFLAAQILLWGVLAMAWWRNASQWTAGKKWLTALGVMVLALVPIGMRQASSPAVYPPMDPSTGGPTGASLLGSTLVVVLLLMTLPRACGLARCGAGSGKLPMMAMLLSVAVFGWAEAKGGTHRDFRQIFALGLLLPWPWWLVRDWRGFVWPAGTADWRRALLLWWALLVVSGFTVYLPGVLDRMKFTHGLVAHSHLAMAGFTTSFCALVLHLLGARFGNRSSFWLWQAAALIMVAGLAAVGWGESAGVAWMVEAPPWRMGGLILRTLCGAAMLIASVHWWLTWKTE